ncbi:MAG: ROK family protein [Planctomycetes bacterium]|nr:ROK family protein [Planctomycetota bacterium]
MVPPLDPAFRPASLATRTYRQAVRRSKRGIPLVIGLERENGLLSRHETRIHPPTRGSVDDTIRYVERLVKFLLWARGGWKIHFGGPLDIGDYIRRLYRQDGERAFDADLMGRVYERPFDVVVTKPEDVPPAREVEAPLGGHMEGCRIGFDLGASDYKIAAVKDGEVVFSDETPWNPKDQADPAYHYAALRDGIARAASHLPRIDAIGGSSAGVIVDSRVMVASLFRSVPKDVFEAKVKGLFIRLGEELGVPIQVINDGDVTALAGALSLGERAMLGIAMGSSEAAGYLSPEGRITGWLNELAFAPVDFNPDAAADEWSGDRGVGVMYFSQQAVAKLAPAAGIAFPEGMGLPERLKAVQEKADAGDPEAARIFETIGVYLGYAIPHYADHYDYRNLLILGRVTSGRGGEIILAESKRVLAEEFPEIAGRIALHVPDEKSRRVGQAVAAASLPQTQTVTA